MKTYTKSKTTSILKYKTKTCTLTILIEKKPIYSQLRKLKDLELQNRLGTYSKTTLLSTSRINSKVKCQDNLDKLSIQCLLQNSAGLKTSNVGIKTHLALFTTIKIILVMRELSPKKSHQAVLLLSVEKIYRVKLNSFKNLINLKKLKKKTNIKDNLKSQ